MQRWINIKIRKIYGQTDLYLLPFMILFYSRRLTHTFFTFFIPSLSLSLRRWIFQHFLYCAVSTSSLFFFFALYLSILPLVNTFAFLLWKMQRKTNNKATFYSVSTFRILFRLFFPTPLNHIHPTEIAALHFTKWIHSSMCGGGSTLGKWSRWPCIYTWCTRGLNGGR